MHRSSMRRMQWFLDNYPSRGEQHTVLDVGSLDLNGSYKELFADDRFIYKGLDTTTGPNVNIVAENPYNWDMINDEAFDIVISGQAFEHIEFFWLTIHEMVRVLKRNGLLCIIVPRNSKLHRHPVDAYRFDTDGMLAIAKYANLLSLHASTNLAPPHAPLDFYNDNDADSMLVARKPADWQGLLNHKRYVFAQNDLTALSTGFISLSQRLFLDQLNRLSDKRLAIFGANDFGRSVKAFVQSHGFSVDFYVDNNKAIHGCFMDEIEIICPEISFRISSGNYIIAVHSNEASNRIYSQLKTMGAAEENIFGAELLWK